jgi:hypothetical protein
MYTKKGKAISENIKQYDSWTKSNPFPDVVNYYDFLKCIRHGNIDTLKSDCDEKDIVLNGYFQSNMGRKFYNLYASYDAKLNIETGEAWSITSPYYNIISHKTINQLLEEGTLVDHNYAKNEN